MSQLLPGYLVSGNAVVNMASFPNRRLAVLQLMFFSTAIQGLLAANVDYEQPNHNRHETRSLYENPA